MASRTRIWLRKQGRAVNPSAVSEALSAHRKSKKEGTDLGLKQEDVLRSFDAGEEVRTIFFYSVVACQFFLKKKTWLVVGRSRTNSNFASTSCIPSRTTPVFKSTSTLDG